MTFVRALLASWHINRGEKRRFYGTNEVKIAPATPTSALPDAFMKLKIPSLLLVSSLSVSLLGTGLAQQSLGDAARQARKNKPTEPTTKVITNDDLKSSGGLALPDTAGSAAIASDQEAKSDADKDKDKEKDKDKAKASLSPDDQAKLDKEWQEKISNQKDQIALLERELEVLQRENKLRATNYYADAGTRLRNEQKYAEDDRKYQADIAAKQKAIDDAKAELERMQEEARKVGANGVG